MVSNHYKTKRYIREKFINEYLGGDGNVVDSFIINREHPMGEEVHCITDAGLIIIYNAQSQKLITKLLARPQQIKRYYESTGREHPPEYEHILNLTTLYNILGFNEI